jgi:hypothetical protein
MNRQMAYFWLSTAAKRFFEPLEILESFGHNDLICSNDFQQLVS